jgi:hypothetical protein
MITLSWADHPGAGYWLCHLAAFCDPGVMGPLPLGFNPVIPYVRGELQALSKFQMYQSLYIYF